MMPTAVVRPLPGPGLVARSGDLMLVCADGAAGVEELLGLVAEVAAANGDGGMLVRRVAAALAADFSGRYPACAACGPTPDGRLAVLVYGNATAQVVGGEGVLTLSAADAITSVNRLVAGPISAVRLELPGAGTANPLARLEAGVVSAAGVVSGEGLSIGPSAAASAIPSEQWPPPRTEAAPAEAAPAEAAFADSALAESAPVEALGPDVAWSASSMMDSVTAPEWLPAPAAEWPPVPAPLPPVPFTAPPPPIPTELAPATPEPLPVRQPSPGTAFVSVPVGAAVDAEPAAPMVDVRPRVLGLACSNGHLNDPSWPACRTCGGPLAGQAMREGPRPPLGVLALDDGSAFILETGYVLGREPQQDPEVLAGNAHSLKITDADGVVSRRHVRVTLVGWDIQVIDLGSANGTFVQFPGDPQLHQLTPHHPIVIGPGTQVTMGRRWFRLEALAPDSGRS